MIQHGLKRLNASRRRYFDNPSRATLRTLLRIKSARGVYDRRIFDYYHVSDRVIDRVKSAARRGYANGLVPTSTTGGSHSPGSLHPSGHAVDLGLIESEIGTGQGRRRLVNHQKREFEAWRAGDRPHMVELIGPDNNMVVLRGRHSPLAEGSILENQHDNHVHQGFN